jgi:FkbM family methyltransferase
MKIVKDKFLKNIYFPENDASISDEINRRGCWEEKEIMWMFKNLSKNMICINVGANVGYHACILSKIVGKNGKVFAFEPNPKLFEALYKNTNNQKNKNIEIIEKAAGSKEDNKYLFLNDLNCGDNRLFDPKIVPEREKNNLWSGFGFDEKTQSVEIDVVPIDSIIDQKIDFVLIDAQGWEYEVIRGMKKIIENSKPKMIVEFSKSWLESLGENPLHFLQDFVDMGYSIGCIETNVQKGLSPKEIINIINDENNNFYYVNIILT